MTNGLTKDKGKKLRDPIHGFIHVSSTELEVINDPVFQRTRNIKQLSLGYYVYHGAEHSRFGHMIGSAHIAGLAFDSLKQNTKELGRDFGASDTDRETLRMAALLHDIGHAPFSHSLGNILESSHEKYSQELVKHHFEDILDKAGIEPSDVIELIQGLHSEKPYLSKIVSGQLDVDRLDYLLRDSYYSGVTYGKYDLRRIIEQLAIVDNKFVVLQGGYEAVEQLIFARYQMYQQVYFHKTKRVFELMLERCGKILQENKLLEYPKLKDLETEEGIKEYIERDDRWFLNQILPSSNSDVKAIANMIKDRKPYLETYSPISSRNRTKILKSVQANETDLKDIEHKLINELSVMGITNNEFLIDVLSRSAYTLMPNHDTRDDDNYDDEKDSIFIYYKNNKLIEPIEKRSSIISSLDQNQPFMNRGFVIPEKYNLVKDYLQKEFKYTLPKRDK